MTGTDVPLVSLLRSLGVARCHDFLCPSSVVPNSGFLASSPLVAANAFALHAHEGSRRFRPQVDGSDLLAPYLRVESTETHKEVRHGSKEQDPRPPEQEAPAAESHSPSGPTTGCRSPDGSSPIPRSGTHRLRRPSARCG